MDFISYIHKKKKLACVIRLFLINHLKPWSSSTIIILIFIFLLLLNANKTCEVMNERLKVEDVMRIRFSTHSHNNLTRYCWTYNSSHICFSLKKILVRSCFVVLIIVYVFVHQKKYASDYISIICLFWFLKPHKEAYYFSGQNKKEAYYFFCLRKYIIWIY